MGINQTPAGGVDLQDVIGFLENQSQNHMYGRNQSQLMS